MEGGGCQREGLKGAKVQIGAELLCKGGKVEDNQSTEYRVQSTEYRVRITEER